MMRHPILALSVAGLFFAAPVLAFQDSKPSPDKTGAAARQPLPPLSGPRVHVTDAPGAYMSFGAGEQNARMARSNLREYGAILKEMTLTDEQREKAKAIADEFMGQMRIFQTEHADELRDLLARSGYSRAPRAARRLAGDGSPSQPPPSRRGVNDRASEAPPSDRPTDRPADRETDRRTDRRPAPPSDRPTPPGDARPNDRRPAADGAMTDAMQPSPEAQKAMAEARAQLEALREEAPPQEPYMKRLYALLTPEQQKDFDARLETARQAQLEQQLRRRLAAAGVDPNSMQGNSGVKIGPDGHLMIDESQLTPQMRERLARAREQRRRAIENRGNRDNPAPPSPDDIRFEKPQP